MKIIVAQTAGFCMGVKRVVDIAIDLSHKTTTKLYTLGPLIHNNQTLELLKKHGVFTYNEKEALPPRSTLLIRAHGVPPQVQRNYEAQGHLIIDGTCPKVKTVHKVIQKYKEQGYTIIIAGDKGHAEVIGLLGYAADAGYLIQSPTDIDTLPDFTKLCLVSQTTFDRETFDAIAEKIKQKYRNSEVVVKKTICSATDLRQTETREIAAKVDAMIVVGGKNSANTQRLVKISESCGTPTQAVETEQEIDCGKLANCNSIGVTAGASTPSWMIHRVVDFLLLKDKQNKKIPRNFFLNILDIFCHLNFFAALGAVAIYYTSCVMQGYSFSLSAALIVFLYFLSMYLWNSLASIESTAHLGINRYQFYSRYRFSLFSLVIFCMVLLLFLAYMCGIRVLYLMLFSTIAGTLYHITIVPRPLRSFLRYSTLKDIPTSRDLFVALAWAIILTFIPHAIKGKIEWDIAVIFTFGLIFVLGFLRSLIFDLKDIEGDRIMGRETLITIIGERKATKGINIALISCIGVLLFSPLVIGLYAGTLKNRQNFIFIMQLPVFLYCLGFFRWKYLIKREQSTLFGGLADSQFYLSALCSLFADTILLS